MSEARPGAVAVSVAIVAYNALDKLRACLDSLAAQEGVPHQTILVDNASAEPVAETVARDYPWVELIASDTNLGFAGGTNLALSRATGPLLLWLNPDTELPEPNTLRRLLDAYAEHPSGILGCRLEYSDGTPQPFSGRYPRAWSEALDLLHLGPRPAPAQGAGWAPVEYVSGACLLTKREAREAVGPLDEGYFMYFEDADWCRRAVRLGYRCGVDPTITVRHHEGASYGDRTFLRREHYWVALLRFVRRFDGPGPAALLRLALVATALPKLGVAALVDRGPERAARRRLLAAQLRLGLRGR